MKLFANLLRERVVLEEPVQAADTLGGGAITYVPRQTRWAEVRAAGAAARFSEDRDENVMRYVVMLRAPCIAKRNWRLNWGAERLRVETVENASPREVRLECVREGAGP